MKQNNETKSSNANDSFVAADCGVFINSERNTNYECDFVD